VPFHIRDFETDRLVRELARKKRSGLTETVREAVRRELNEVNKRLPLAERIKGIQDDFAALAKTGLKADKPFYDWLSEEDER